MAADAANYGDEWEYEYSTTETETFYVDLDLSSVNGVIKSKNAGDRKTLKKPAKLAKAASVSRASNNATAADEDGDAQEQNNSDDNVGGADEERENGEGEDANSPQQVQSPREPGSSDNDYTGRMQLLDFDTTNPIVSYNGAVYSCTWHDMLGTSLFISKHDDAPFHEPEIATEDYDLIGTSRIKLVGKRARILPKAGSRKRKKDENDEMLDDSQIVGGLQPSTMNGKSLGTITRTNPKTNIEIKQQASFLEKLAEVKKARGETDVVRTYVDRYTAAADARHAGKVRRKGNTNRGKGKDKGKGKEESAQQKLRREINELNKRVVRGDNDALERLQEIYADMEEVEDDEDETLIGANSAMAPMNNHPDTDQVEEARVPADEASAQVPHVPGSNPNGASGS